MSWLGNLFGGHAPAGHPIPEGALLVDVRSPAEYAGGHLQGACLMPLPHGTIRWKRGFRRKPPNILSALRQTYGRPMLR